MRVSSWPRRIGFKLPRRLSLWLLLLLFCTAFLWYGYLNEPQPTSEPSGEQSNEQNAVIVIRKVVEDAHRHQHQHEHEHQHQAPVWDACPTVEAQGDINVAAMIETLPPERSIVDTSWRHPAEAQNNSRKLHVYIMPHSHTDPGWLETVDDYFTRQVKGILTSTIHALHANQSMRFVFAEICFLEMFFSQANEAERSLLLDALESKRLELVTGGWVMTDEASAHVYTMLEQLVEGHAYLDYLNEVARKAGRKLNLKPLASWSIDPFGYSSTMPYLLSKSRIPNLVINRIHYSLKTQLATRKQLQFLWRQPFDSLGEHDVLTHVLPYDTYDMVDTCGPDKGVCCQFDFLRMSKGPLRCFWGDNAQEIGPENVRQQSLKLLNQYRKKAALFRTDKLLVELGGDFRYSAPLDFERQFANYEKIFDFLNGNPQFNVHIQWSTLSEYFASLRSSLGNEKHTAAPPLPSLVGDFFVYADRGQEYWSGYFTSRPFHKWLSRQLENELRTAEQLMTYSIYATLANGKAPSAYQELERSLSELQEVRRALALFQHHDSMTGTSRRAVMKDNWDRLIVALNKAKQLIRESSVRLFLQRTEHEGLQSDINELSASMFTSDQVHELPQRRLVNVNGKTQILLYNSLSIRRRSLHQVLVDTPYIGVSANGRYVEAQVEPIWSNDTLIVANSFRLTFRIDIPPLAFAVFYLAQFSSEAEMTSKSATRLVHIELYNLWSHSTEDSTLLPFKIRQVDTTSYIKLLGDRVKAFVDSSTGMLSYVHVNESKVRAELSFFTYASYRSGAYLFIPTGSAVPISANQPLIRVLRGGLVDQVQVSVQYVQHTLRFVKAKGLLITDTIEFDNVVDLVDNNLELGMQLQTDFNTGKDGQSVFNTDQNCFRMTRRKTNMPGTPLQANVYPFTCAAFIDDLDRPVRMSVLTQQSLSVSSLKSGSLEVMLDRRLAQDDGRGLSEAVEDNKPTPSSFRIRFSVDKERADLPNDDALHRQLKADDYWTMLDLNFPLYLLVPAVGADKLPSELELARADAVFPCDMHVVNLRASSNEGHYSFSVFLHRLALDCASLQAHTLTKICNTTASGTVDLLSLFYDSRRPVLQGIKKMSLTLLEEFESVSMDQGAVVSLPHFEIEAFKMNVN